ncbi:hypothetical protein H2202_004247 [Exophiala xenobiotica]|nr:hypothetical protein H2202_004247 [Exophiala xenobiotica]
MARGPLRRSVSITDLRFTLRRVFGKDSFRPLQEEVITDVLAGHDVFLCAATSFGKSLCYQLPAVVSLGVTVVISPLLALMTNQVQAARDLGVAVECINGKTGYQERLRIETDLLCGHPATKLLYVTPELCATNHFRELVMRIHRQGQLVREDIFKFLGLVNSKTKSFSTSTARPNIHYEIQYFSESNPENGQDDVFPYLISRVDFMHQRRLLRLRHLRQQDPAAAIAPITGIIYVSYRASADSLATKLTEAGIRAQSYHAGLEDAQRLKVQNSFLRHATADPRLLQSAGGHNLLSSFNIMCATTAFGMGIDIPTIRFVIHYGLPRGMESFAQESGRAGRDNKAASSIILYTREEKERSEFRAKSDANREKSRPKAESRLVSLQSVIGFCENTDTCRHDLLARYFGDNPGSAECYYACDVCKEGPVKLKKRKEKGLATEDDAFAFTQRQPMRDYDYD